MNYLNESAKSNALLSQPENIPVKNGLTSSASTVINEVQNLICFSHIRWDSGCQRPQHLLARASKKWNVWYIEEPQWDETVRMEIRRINDQLQVVVPYLPYSIDEQMYCQQQRQLVDQLLNGEELTDFVAWYYTPTALQFTDHLRPRLTIYDCLDELSAFPSASPTLLEQEKKLMQLADLVSRNRFSLYEAKCNRHPRVVSIPDGVDHPHFSSGRQLLPDPEDQQSIGKPRIGFCGVIDERLNGYLLGQLARRRPDWQFVLLGDVVTTNPAALPLGANLHYLSTKSYPDLPAYLSNWQVAIIPFVINDAARSADLHHTQEYLAAGLPVVSTPLPDVVQAYGGCGPVFIGDSVSAIEQAIEIALTKTFNADWETVDAMLTEQYWDKTWARMQQLVIKQLQNVYPQQEELSTS